MNTYADLVTAVATAFARQADRATQQGLLQGYRVEEVSSPVLRGRVRTAEQIKRRFSLAVPLEVRYDEYGVDIPENQLLRGAASVLLRLRRLDSVTRRSLLRLMRSVYSYGASDGGAVWAIDFDWIHKSGRGASSEVTGGVLGRLAGLPGVAERSADAEELGWHRRPSIPAKPSDPSDCCR